ncbi:respiratory chain complex I subunit 1 family protein [Methanobrevibacter curvatus]|uniref:NAD(P)H-quinone oxidoreductase subunit 1, chloroplastic n=1 Tax=Methanobrevibacter curvatus TaxID=49547 RepID=A0A166CGJ5_9EURY|nr:NADH-quinone oxidoreductase subunit H [Methanobrevibacter curvatus]KZX14137.1 NAD(P)H-quinone oxidoreductase subunit 1, chloroplastic [Methanobrevibacter curvatus]
MITILSFKSILAILATLIIAFIISIFIPGIERKYIHGRIQQRIGPPLFSPGLMAPIKFFFKENLKPNSPLPKLYKSLPVISFIVIFLILLFIIPQFYIYGSLASVIAIVGLLKVEEIAYVLMGSLSKSVMSTGMSFPDKIKGAKHLNVKSSFIEDISSSRALRLIIFGSFPLYLALFVPVSTVGSVYLSDILSYQISHGPILFSVSGIIGAIVFFIGYMILLNEYPFAILKTKADVIEGPYMEYSSKYRAINYINRGFLIFVLGSLFSLMFLGYPSNIFSWKFIINVLVALIFPVLMAILSAFSPIFTNKQFYPVILVSSIFGVLAILLGLLI